MLSAFVRRTAIVSEGRAWWRVRRPTLGDIVLALQLLGAEISEVVDDSVIGNATRKDIPLAIEGFLRSLGPRDRRGAIVARHLVVEAGDPASEVPVQAVLSAALGLVDDLSAVRSSFVTSESGGDGGGGSPDDPVFGLVIIARWFGVTPLELMDWPYEAFLLASEAMRRISEQEAGQKSLPISAAPGGTVLRAVPKA